MLQVRRKKENLSFFLIDRREMLLFTLILYISDFSRQILQKKIKSKLQKTYYLSRYKMNVINECKK